MRLPKPPSSDTRLSDGMAVSSGSARTRRFSRPVAQSFECGSLRLAYRFMLTRVRRAYRPTGDRLQSDHPTTRDWQAQRPDRRPRFRELQLDRQVPRWGRHHPAPAAQRARPFRRRQVRSHEEVQAIDFAPDGRTIVSALANRVIVWDLQSARVRRVLDTHQSPVTGLVVHEQLVYSSHADATVKVTELEGSSGITKLKDPTPVSESYFTMSAQARQSISLPTMDRTEPGCDAGRLFEAAASPNDRYLAMYLGNCVVVRDLATAQTLAILPVHRPGPGHVSLGMGVRFLGDESLLTRTPRATGRRWRRSCPSCDGTGHRTGFRLLGLFRSAGETVPVAVSSWLRATMAIGLQSAAPRGSRRFGTVRLPDRSDEFPCLQYATVGV